MRSEWLQRTGSQEVIVVFGGWALGSAPFAALKGDSDLLFVEDWRSLDGALPNLGGYETRLLVAFSFGVAAAGHWIAAHGDQFDRKVAVNGTLDPVSASHGISAEMVEATASGLSVASFSSFCRRAGVKPAPAIDLEARRAELRAVAQRGQASALRFDRIWLSRKDRIFPPAALQAAWADQADDVRWLDSAPHSPFAVGQTWGDWRA